MARYRNELGELVCKQLGLDSNAVYKISLISEAGKVDKLSIELVAEIDMVAIIHEFELVPKIPVEA
jgi:hypothetical protein